MRQEEKKDTELLNKSWKLKSINSGASLMIKDNQKSQFGKDTLILPPTLLYLYSNSIFSTNKLLVVNKFSGSIILIHIVSLVRRIQDL